MHRAEQMALHAPRRDAEVGGDVVGAEALEMSEHEDLPLAGGKLPERRPDTGVLLAPGRLVLGGGAGAGRRVAVELETATAPPPPPPRPPPVPTRVHRDPGAPCRPLVLQRHARRP